MKFLATVLLLCTAAQPGGAATSVTLLHFSDYHSHALPFYSEDRPDQGGIARAISYLKRHKRNGALVFSGGDMMNKGAPAWSDQYQCAEWPWLNGIVDAMAFGNHDADYGYESFRSCKAAVRYPILSANTEGMTGLFEKYRVFNVGGVRVGVFAVAGPDFARLVKIPELRFSDSVAAAREVVRQLREVEHVHAIVLIGHEHTNDDFAMARTVPGIDLIFGTHSHQKQEIMQIPGTTTFFIAPYQYLTYISRVDLTFDGGKLTGVRGELVRIDPSVAADRAVARRVSRMQRELERDRQYRDLFVPIGMAGQPVALDELAKLTVDVMKVATKADVALSTISSFRQAIPPGEVNLEILRAALPYDNEIVVDTMSGEQIQKLLALGSSRKGTDSYLIVSDAPTFESEKSYRVATTDYLAQAAGYRDFFPTVERTGLRVRDEVRKSLAVTTLRRP